MCTWPKPHEPFGYFLNDQTLRLSNGTEINAFVAHRHCMVKFDPKICQTSTFPQRLYQDDFTADQAATLLKRAPKDKPWFMWVSFPGPHPPFAVTEEMGNETAGRRWPNPVDSKRKVPNCEQNLMEPSNARTRCNYGAEMENLDRLFGKVLDAVKERGNSIEKDTIACFFSDHGEMLNDHDDVDKSKPWQGALNVPLVCAGPGIRGNISLEVPIATIDIGATVLDIANAWQYRDSNMTARSFRGLLESADQTKLNRTVIHSGLQKSAFSDGNEKGAIEGRRNEWSFRLVVSEFNGPPMSTYKFICCKGKCPGAPKYVGRPDKDGYTKLLFDTVADPFDMHDLKLKLPQVAEALRRELPVIHGFNCSSL